MERAAHGTQSGEDLELVGGMRELGPNGDHRSQSILVRARAAAKVSTALLLVAAAAFVAVSGWTASTRRGALRDSLGLSQWPPSGPEDLDPNTMTDIVECGLDVGQAIYRLSDAATSIQEARAACEKTSTDDEKATCSSSVNSILYNFIFVATTLSQSVTDCAHQVNAPAVCSTVITGMIANLGAIAGSASALTQSCHLYNGPPPRPNASKVEEAKQKLLTGVNFVPPPVTVGAEQDSAYALQAQMVQGPYGKPATLQTTTPMPLMDFFKQVLFNKPGAVPLGWLALHGQKQADYQSAIVQCWFSVGQGAAFLARAAIGLAQAVIKCDPLESVPAGELGQRKCSVNIIGLLGGLAWAARFLSQAVPTCAGGDYEHFMEAQCAADIVGVAAGIFAAAAPAIQLGDQCKTLVEQMLPRGRRLSQDVPVDVLAGALSAPPAGEPQGASDDALLASLAIEVHRLRLLVGGGTLAGGVVGHASGKDR